LGSVWVWVGVDLMGLGKDTGVNESCVEAAQHMPTPPFAAAHYAITRNTAPPHQQQRVQQRPRARHPVQQRLLRRGAVQRGPGGPGAQARERGGEGSVQGLEQQLGGVLPGCGACVRVGLLLRLRWLRCRIRRSTQSAEQAHGAQPPKQAPARASPQEARKPEQAAPKRRRPPSRLHLGALTL